MSWEHVDVGGTGPGARARLSLVFDRNQPIGDNGRLYLFGGENATGQPDGNVYVTDPWSGFGTSATINPTDWQAWADPGFTVSGHTALIDYPGLSGLERQAEVFDPTGSGSWDSPEGATLYQFDYPPTFVIPDEGAPGGRVLSFEGFSGTAYWLDVPAAGNPSNGWQVHESVGFAPQTGVAYRPDRIMVAGARNVLTGATKTLDTSDLENSWVTSGSMAPRAYHNLVVLPNGKVMVVGGVQSTSSSATGPSEKRPQIWDPDANGGVGAWTDPNTLAIQSRLRNYHSTAILLPDGRVLSAGGDWQNDKYYAEIYCPPYLFKPASNDTARRPVISGAPSTLAWGDTFTVCTPNAADIQKVALIRPGATTHTFDQNQRYVPLEFEAASNPTRLLVIAPEGADAAPPGHYMLFLVGSEDADEVPSYAHWVRMVDPQGPDVCDTVAPGELDDLVVDFVTTNAIYGFGWTATADDALLAASGKSHRFDLRYSANPIDSQANWGLASQVSGEPAPGPVSTAHYLEDGIEGLQSCTWYHLAIRAEDDNQNLSALHEEVKVKTLCGTGGCCSAHRVEDLEAVSHPDATTVAAGVAQAMGGTTSSPGATLMPSEFGRRVGSTSMTRAGGPVVVRTDRDSDGMWEVTISAVAEVAGLGEADTSGVIVQIADGAVWRTLGRLAPDVQTDVLGLCALREGGRTVVLGNWVAGQVAGALRMGEGALELHSGTHSETGDLGSEFTSAGGAVAIDAGESVTLTYRKTEEPVDPGQAWFVRLERGDPGGARGHEVPRISETRPTSFALHQNEPNPFGAATTIRFDLPRAAHVTLEVFDLLGRRVATLADAQFPAGFHAVPWGASERAGVGPGIYMYRLSAGTFRSQRKMILLP